MSLDSLTQVLQQNDHDNFLDEEHIPNTAVHESWIHCPCEWAKRLRMEIPDGNLNEFVLKSNGITERLRELFVERFPGDPLADEGISQHILKLEETIRDLKIEAQSAFRLRGERRKVVSDEEKKIREKRDREYKKDPTRDGQPKTRQTSLEKARQALIKCGIDPSEFFKETLGKK